MYKHKESYAFEAGGEERLTLSWNSDWRDFTVSLDGNPVGVVPNQKALRNGYEMSLPDGSTLKIKLVIIYLEEKLQILRNGQPLPDSESDPNYRLRRACRAIYLIAAYVGLMGVVTFSSFPEFARNFNSARIIFFSFAFLVLGFFTQRKSVIALILAIILVMGYIVVTHSFVVFLGYQEGVGPYATVFLFLFVMLPGVKAIRELKQKEA